MHTLEIRITGKTKLDLIMGALALVSVLRDWHAGGSPKRDRVGANHEIRTEYLAPAHQ